MKSLKRAHILLILTVLGFVLFWPLTSTFFQQDEWAIFGNFIYWEKAHLPWFTRLFIYEQDTHLIPLSTFLSYIQFKTFGLDFTLYAITSIVIHVINAYLVFLLAQQLTGNKKISFFASSLFLVNASTAQAITWTATTIGTAGSTSFVLLSLIFFHRYIRTDKKFSLNLILSLISFMISLGFKEISIFLFAFLPLYVFFVSGKKDKSQLTIVVLCLFALGLIYGLTRVIISSFWTQSAATGEELSQAALPVYLYRFVTNPVRLLAQSIVPAPIIISLARIVVQLAYPQFVVDGAPEPAVVDTVASDIVSFFITAIVLFGFVYFYKTLKKQKLHNWAITLIVSLVYIVVSTVPFIIIPGRAGYISLFDGRHLYMTSIFVAIIVSLCIYYMYQLVRKSRPRRLIIMIVATLYVSFQIFTIWKDLYGQQKVARFRRLILNTIITEYPSLPSKVIFYVESDKEYYGVPIGETIVPFQSGFGQTLLVWYNAHGENFPACFFERKYLYPLIAQDYKECDGRGFGFFRSYSTMKQALEEHNLVPDAVIAYEWRDKTKQLVSITKQIRIKLRITK